jgi:hypothetical protein
MDVPAAQQINVERSPSQAVTIESDVMSDKKNPDDESDGLEFLAPPTRPDSQGRIGHYEVLDVLGRGGFGIVLQAFDDVLQRVVAVKGNDATDGHHVAGPQAVRPRGSHLRASSA